MKIENGDISAVILLSAFFILKITITVSIVFTFLIYAKLVKLHKKVKSLRLGAYLQLKKRSDLIPKFVEIFKNYLDKEKLDDLLKAKYRTQRALNIEEKNRAERLLAEKLHLIFAFADEHPELKKNTRFLIHRKILDDIEAMVYFACQEYNDLALQINKLIGAFPSSIIAKMFRFKKEKLLEIDKP